MAVRASETTLRADLESPPPPPQVWDAFLTSRARGASIDRLQKEILHLARTLELTPPPPIILQETFLFSFLFSPKKIDSAQPARG